MTQKDEIIKYIRMFGSISPIEAFADLGVTKLATRISEMRNDPRYRDIKIQKKTEQTVTRLGKKTNYTRYSIGGNND